MKWNAALALAAALAAPAVAAQAPAEAKAPEVLNVWAIGGSSLVRIIFSAPLYKATAENAANYHIEPDLTVLSAKVRPGGRAVDLQVTPVPGVDQFYSLSTERLKGRPPASAPVSGEGTTFSTLAPAFRMWFNSRGEAVVGGYAAPASVKALGAPKPSGSLAAPSLALSGKADGMAVRNSAELNPSNAFTLTAWVRARDWSGDRPIVSKGRDGSQYSLTVHDSILAFRVPGVGEVRVKAPAPGSFRHLAASYDGLALRLYVDGSLRGTAAAKGKPRITSDPLLVGRSTLAPAGAAFRGEISDVRLYAVAVIPDHIRALADRATGN
ncbi:MAG TPA: LamG domain-containing protein [Armatimonadota bacterium]|jgi:hypothetical protein